MTRSIGDIRPVCCAAPDYLAARGRSEHPQALQDHECIGFEGAFSGREWPFLIAGERLSVQVAPRLVVNTAEAAIDAAVAGAGITRVLFYQAAKAVRLCRLEPVLEPFALPAWPVQLVHAMRGLAPQKLRLFMDFAAPRLRAGLVARG